MVIFPRTAIRNKAARTRVSAPHGYFFMVYFFSEDW